MSEHITVKTTRDLIDDAINALDPLLASDNPYSIWLGMRIKERLDKALNQLQYVNENMNTGDK